MNDAIPHSEPPRWNHEPLEESLDGATQLTVSVVDRTARDGWEPMARVLGIPARRWQRHHPLRSDEPLIALVDGRPAFDAAAWARFVSLAPGAVALPTRTSATYGITRAELRPPGHAPLRIVDLWRARRAARRLRRLERTLPAEVARAGSIMEQQAQDALRAGDDQTPLDQLPAYALAARIEQLLRWHPSRDASAIVDLAASTITSRILQQLIERGSAPGEALLATAQLTAGAAIPPPRWLAELDELAPSDPTALQGWLDRHGWHALRALHLDAPPLRDMPDAVARWHADAVTARGQHEHGEQPSDELLQHLGIEARSVLAELIQRARVLTALREQVGQHRIELHAALRALVSMLAKQLTRSGVIEDADDVHQLTIDELLLAARGGTVAVRPSTPAGRGDVSASDPSASTPQLVELRGIPASRGIVDAPIVLLEQPGIDEPVTGAILVCRVTDPGWMPLLLRCAGLVTERGGPLSHAAIVARELGIPAVVGVTDARAKMRAAGTTRARIDGTTGAVRCEP